jgi:hypothetical protein
MVQINSPNFRPLIGILRDPVSTTSWQSLIYLLASVQSRFLRALLILFYSICIYWIFGYKSFRKCVVLSQRGGLDAEVGRSSTGGDL